MSTLDPGSRPGHADRNGAEPARPRLTLPPRPGTLTVGRLKVTLVLNAAETRRHHRPRW